MESANGNIEGGTGIIALVSSSRPARPPAPQRRLLCFCLLFLRPSRPSHLARTHSWTCLPTCICNLQFAPANLLIYLSQQSPATKTQLTTIRRSPAIESCLQALLAPTRLLTRWRCNVAGPGRPSAIGHTLDRLPHPRLPSSSDSIFSTTLTSAAHCCLISPLLAHVYGLSKAFAPCFNSFIISTLLSCKTALPHRSLCLIPRARQSASTQKNGRGGSRT